MTVFNRVFGPSREPRELLRNIAIILLMLTTAVSAGFIAVNQNFIIVAGFVIAVVSVLALTMRPDVPTLAVLLLIYTNAAGVAVKFHGVPFIVGAAVPLMLLIPLTNSLIFRREKIIFHPMLLWVIVYHIVGLVGLVRAVELDFATEYFFRTLVEGVVLYFLVINVVRTQTVLRRVIWTLVIGGGLIGGISLFQVATSTYSNNYGGFAQVSNAAFGTGQETLQGEVEQPRLAGSIGEQNRYAQVMLMLVPLGLFRVWDEKNKLLQLAAAVFTGLVVIGVATSFSRGAALGFAAMIGMLVVLRYIKIQQLYVLGLGFALVMIVLPQYATRVLKLQGLVGLFSNGDNVTQETKADGSLEKRTTEMLAAAYVFADYPILGVGPGMFPFYYKEYAQRVGVNIQLDNTRKSHNLYLSIAADHGILGLISYMAVVILTMYHLSRVRRRWKDERPDLANLAAGFLLAIFTYLVTGIGLHFTFVRYFWTIMALAATVVYVSDKAELRARERQEWLSQLAPVVSQASASL